MTARGALAARTALWLTLAGWVGSWAFFALVIARIAFQVLPSPEIAGHLVRPVLNTLHWYGAIAGVAIAVLAAVLKRGRLLVVAPLVLAGVCLFSQLCVTPKLEAIRDLAFGPEGNLEATAQYRHLHGLSMILFTGVLAGAIAVLVLHVRREHPDATGHA
jgi:hypothetical protein